MFVEGLLGFMPIGWLGVEPVPVPVAIGASPLREPSLLGFDGAGGGVGLRLEALSMPAREEVSTKGVLTALHFPYSQASPAQDPDTKLS